MITRLAELAVERRRAVISATLVLIALSLWPALQLPLDALPDLTNNQVIVLTNAPGLSPEEVEQTVTRPLELALSGLPTLREQRSLSRYGISSVTVVFEDHTDPWLARQMVAERLASVALPSGVEQPVLGPMTGGLGEIFHLTLSSSVRPPAELLELSMLRVAPLLRSVKGVVEVNSWGGAIRSFDVVADASSLAARGLTLRKLRDALLEATGVNAAGALSAHDGQVLLRAQARPERSSDLANAVVAPPMLRAAEVAATRDGELLRLGAATANGTGETVYLMVQMLRDENALEVTRRIQRVVPAVRAALPEDVQLRLVYDRSVLVGNTLQTVLKNLLEGFVLVTAVLLAFLGSFRAGLIAASVIPLSMALATAVMALLELPGNLMSLGALDFGLLVDGAVVMVEGVFHQTSEHTAATWTQRVRQTAARSARPVFFSVLVILLVYVPVLSMRGTDGKLFRPMALTVVLAVFFSLLLSLTWVPALLAAWLREQHVPKRDPLLVRLLDRYYPALLRHLLPHRVAVSVGALALVAIGVIALRSRGLEFTPQLDEGDMVIQTTREPDISLESAVAKALILERTLRAAIPEVTSVVSRIGSPAVATDIMGYEQADVFVALKPKQDWREGLTRERLIEHMRRALGAHAPHADPSFTQPIQMRFNELLGGAVTDVAVSLYGEELHELRRLADALAAAFRGVKGAADVRVLAPPSVPMVTVKPRPLSPAQYGLSARDVLDAVQAVRVGLPVGQTWVGALRVPLRLRLNSPSSAASLETLDLPVASGGSIPLSSVADVERGAAPGLVSRRNAQRRLVIGFNVRGDDLGSVVQRAQAEAARQVELPLGYRLEWGGQYESLQEATARLALIVPIVLLMILGVLGATFGRVRPALAVFGLVPLAAVGGVITLWIRDMPISLPAAIGFIALSGIAVMNGVVWMARAIELRVTETDPQLTAYTAALERARPVLMTALVAALGFVPMMLSTGVGAEVQRPLASVVVGGLFTSTLLTLIVLPVLYPWLCGARKT